MEVQRAFSSFLATWLILQGCGDDGDSPQEPGDRPGSPSGMVRPDAGRDGGRDVDMDATVPDAPEPSAPDASAPAAEDAGSEREDAGMDARDAEVELDAEADADTGAQLPSDAGSSTPDAQAPDAAAPPPPACDPSAAPVIGRLGLETIISGQGLAYLTEAHQPPDSNDWYLVQQDGRIRVLREGGALEDFLDLSSEVSLLNDLVYEDRGLVSIEFAPDWATSGRFYLAITPNRGSEANLDQIRSYTRMPGGEIVRGPDILSIEGSHRDVQDITTNIHNGGRLTFGPDGMLYHAMGDGGGVDCGDSELGATQDPSSAFGKLLRLDLSKPEAGYAPGDNPFHELGGTYAPLVLHYGLRNPFRFSFDRLTGDLYLGDVGQNRYEEVDYAPAGSAGLNFGWAHFEGNSEEPCGKRPLRPGSTHTPPIVVADRRAGATDPFRDYNAMIGGVVYRGSALPQLQGVYFFGGFAGARLGALRQCGQVTSRRTPVRKACDANNPGEACFTRIGGGARFDELRAIVEDHDGEMYMVANRDTLFKVVAAP